MTLLKDLITIPEAVHKGDFVMSLASGVTDSKSTLDSYVVTPQLADAYKNALGFIASAITENKSKAAYLDGSFGSGKSHFMAVLHLLLQRDPGARALPELADAIAASDPVLSGCNFALVPFHMIGAESMEQAIFGGYVKHVRDTDPEATLPGVYSDDPLFEQAEVDRGRMGDEAFFAALNDGQSGNGGGWGTLEAAWDATTYEQARAAPVGDPERGRLSGTIVARLMPGFVKAMSGNATGYVDLDTGLAELARHARDRGHQGLILFLDELILWLGSRIRDTAFVEREGQKLIKLIEYTTERPIPIVSFVARQRDLREFVGEELPGADKLSFADALKHWNDRFHRISLADRNLPKIAERRLLRPRGEAERQQIDAAFAQTEKTNPQTLDILMTEEGDRELFRSTYPFSPAFMATLVAASSALQRERTALRVMLQLLVDRRDELTVGDLVSVGELFDVLASGDEPFSDDMKRHFDHARDVYRDQFRPLLLETRKLTEAQAGALPRNHPFRADDQLVKTLLLAALVPGASPLKHLDVAKLTALNHGSIASPIPGGEKGIVLGKLRTWASQVGALKVGDDPQNPSVALRLTGVDIDSVIARAEHVDNLGERKRLVKDLVLGEIGVESGGLFGEHQILWRGTPRTVDVVFGNVRDPSDVSDTTIRASGSRWKVIVDYPFDQGFTPLDDLDRLDRWRSDNGQTDTVCWIPAFFSAGLQRDLAKLVVITHVLGGDRLDQFADHLSQADRVQARGLLSDQRSALEQRVLTAIRQAYGVERAAPETIDASHGIEDHIQSLRPGLVAQIPIGATLGDAFNGLVAQLFDHHYPRHPRIGRPYRLADLRVVLEETLRAVETPDGRIPVPRDRRKFMLAIATPLELGTQHEEPFVLGTRWKDHFDRAIAAAQQEGESQVTVGDLRRWIDQPEPLGLPRDLQSLVILVYAAQSGRVFRQHGGAAEPSIDKLDDDLELVSPQLPSESAWTVAQSRAASVFGIADINPARSSFETLVTTLRSRAQDALPAIQTLVPVVERRIGELDGDVGSSARAQTARAAAALAQTIAQAEDSVAVIEEFAAAQLPSEQHTGTALARAGQVHTALSGERWELLGIAIERAAANEPGFTQVTAALRDAVCADEFAVELEPAVHRAYADAVKLIGATTPTPTATPSHEEPPPAPGVHVARGDRSGVGIDEARAELDRLAQEDGYIRVDLHWTITTKTQDA